MASVPIFQDEKPSDLGLQSWYEYGPLNVMSLINDKVWKVKRSIHDNEFSIGYYFKAKVEFTELYYIYSGQMIKNNTLVGIGRFFEPEGIFYEI